MFRRARCADCHGPQGRGSANGPELRDLARHWTEDELVRFLADPEAFRVRDERLDELARRARTRMTPFDHLPEAHRRRLARYLLAR